MEMLLDHQVSEMVKAAGEAGFDMVTDLVNQFIVERRSYSGKMGTMVPWYDGTIAPW